MCGFVALYDSSGAPIELGVLRAMTDAQRHRGPDDQGFAGFSLGTGTIEPDVVARPGAFEGGFGFNRLSIRDLSAHGHQPMVARGGRAVMVFNGEIYNADEQRDELVAKGHSFVGTSDTEVILALYREHGLDGMLERLNGMFAICLADLDARRFVIARDRLGIKPLYYWRSGSLIAVASEAKSFLAHPRFSARLDEESFSEYLAFRSCAKDRHLLSDVRQAEPGEVIDAAGADLRRRRYWRPPTARTWTRSYGEAVDAVEAQLEKSVKLQLVSDVPVGCQFSGGLDSSMVSAFANRHTKRRGHYQSFSILVDDPRFDEERWIDIAGRHLGVDGHKFRFGEREFASRLDRATWHLDQPLDHMNSIGIDLLAEGSRPHVTVLLSGEGADEVFGGYARFLRILYRPFLQPVAPAFARIPRVGDKLATFGVSRGRGDRDWFIRASSPILPELVAQLTGQRHHYDRAMDLRRAMFPTEGDLLARCRAYELETFLVGLLNRQDKMTMRHSLENRVPLLDHDLVELVSGMPDDFSVTRRPSLHPLERNTKRILKRVAERHFDKSFVYRPKEGFGMPIARYFRSDAMRPIVERAIASARKRGVIDARVLERWWKEDLARPFIAEALWIGIAFELWAAQVLDGDRRELGVAA